MAQGSGSVVQTFLFADLSGFTALTEVHGDEQAADLVGGFCVAVRQLLAAHQAQEVKAIGDALVLRTADAVAAIRLGLCIVHDVGAQHGFPLVRVGMHTGSAVERISAAAFVAALAALRRFGPALEERAMRKCEQMFDRMPADFPPKRMLRGIERIQEQNMHILRRLQEEEEEEEEHGRTALAAGV